MARQNSTASERLRMSLNREEGLAELDQIVLKYGMVEGKPYSFKDHEYQQEIIKDTQSRIDVQKCSQVGASEMAVQKALAIMAVMSYIRVMFSLPTKEMAGTFSKDRFDGLIEQSDFYGSLVAAGGNSAGQKKIGSNMLYVVGTFGAKGAISVPVEFLMSDEVDFSNEVVLGKMNSRLRHANSVDEKGNRGYRFRFSTPTVEGYGINEGFSAGDQRYYMCKCEHCEHWVLPDFYTDFIVPGYPGAMASFTIDDARNERFNKEAAWIKCAHCGKDLFSSLVNPARRQWVAKHPHVWDHSYQVFPWDVPKYNTPAAIIKQFADYPLTSDFMNFVIGLPFSDAENSFITSKQWKDKTCTLDLWIFQQVVAHAPTVGGMDIGKTCHLYVKTQVGKGWHVIWMEKLKNTKEEPLAPLVVQRFDYYRMRKLCIDAGPDITLVNQLVSARAGIQAVVYTTITGIVPVHETKAGDVINADRTKTLTLTLKDHNGGNTLYPRRDDLRDELFEHLATTKKIRERDADGNMKERFVKNKKADHWVHAANYAKVAELTLEYIGNDNIAAGPATVTKSKVGGNHREDERKREQAQDPVSVLMGLGGSRSGGIFGRRR